MSISADAARLASGDYDGFTFLDEGYSRRAYLKDGFVFKLHTADGNDDKCNEMEITNYYRLADSLPALFAFPVTDYFDGIIVQEYVQGKLISQYFGTGSAFMQDAAKSTGLLDLDQNVIYDSTDGRYYIFDFVA